MFSYGGLSSGRHRGEACGFTETDRDGGGAGETTGGDGADDGEAIGGSDGIDVGALSTGAGEVALLILSKIGAKSTPKPKPHPKAEIASRKKTRST